jgi:hypothetical protein
MAFANEPVHELPLVGDSVIVPSGQGADAVGLLSEAGDRYAREISVEDRLCSDASDDRVAALSAVLERTPAVRTGIPSLEAAELLREAGVEARPMYRMWSMNHWKYLPGEFPKVPSAQSQADADGKAASPTPSGNDSTHVFVIDSGFDDQHVWRSELARVDAETADDADPVFPSHGTFVASIIGLMAPATRVRVLRAFLEGGGRTPIPGEPTDEVAVSQAIQMVGDVVQNEGIETAIVNLSLGTYNTSRLDRLGSDGPFALEQTIESVRHLGVDFVAAAGNDLNYFGPFRLAYPAAFQGVTAVGASGFDPAVGYMPGQQVIGPWYLWQATGNGRIRMDKGGSDADQKGILLRPGIDLVASAGNSLLAWSGSSVATAIETGLRAGGTIDNVTFD